MSRGDVHRNAADGGTHVYGDVLAGRHLGIGAADNDDEQIQIGDPNPVAVPRGVDLDGETVVRQLLRPGPEEPRAQRLQQTVDLILLTSLEPDGLTKTRHPASVAIVGQMPDEQVAVTGQFIFDHCPLLLQHPAVVPGLLQFLLASQANDAHLFGSLGPVAVG